MRNMKASSPTGQIVMANSDVLEKQLKGQCQSFRKGIHMPNT